MTMRLPMLLLLTTLLLAALVLIMGLSGGPIGRRRVERFAGRHAVIVTADNGPLIVRALGITHRWRRFGLTVGFVLAGLWALREGRLSVDFTAMFLGWFGGAIIAEWRIGAPEASGSRRRADPTARTLASYLTTSNRVALWLAWALLGAAALLAAWIDLPDAGRRVGWAVAVAGCLAGAGVLWAVTRRILDRPRPAEPAHIRDADDALRANSLATIAGSAIALTAWPLSTFVETIVTRLAGTGPGPLAGFVALVAMVGLGWGVAARSASVRRDSQAVAQP